MGERTVDDAAAETANPRLVAIRPGALGDALLTLPVLAWLRGQVPGVRITLVARRDVLPLASGSGVADDVSPYDDIAWSALFADEPPTPRGLAHDVCSGARVAAWTGADDGVVRRILLALGASAVVVAPGKPAPSSQRHMALQLSDGLARLGFPAPTTWEELVERPPLRPTDASRDRISSWLRAHGIESRRLVAAHPGSGGDAKRWPAESFAAVLASLAAEGYTPLLIEGPHDAVVVREIQAAPWPQAGSAPVARDLPVEDLAALLGQCAAYVGNDSGVTHLAALAGCPTVAIFGPSDDALWRPLGRRVLVIRAATDRVEDVPTQSVAALLRDLLAGK